MLFSSGCNLLTYPTYILFGQTHQSVKAEYRDLAGKKIAIIVAGQPAIEFEQPYARMDLALVSAQSISDHVKNVTFADQDQIDRFQRESLDWYSVSISEIARKFDAQSVLYIDLIQNKNGFGKRLNIEKILSLQVPFQLGMIRPRGIHVDDNFVFARAQRPPCNGEITAEFPESPFMASRDLGTDEGNGGVVSEGVSSAFAPRCRCRARRLHG